MLALLRLSITMFGVRFAPRTDPRVLDAIRRLDDRRVPIAETSRRVGAALEELGVPRPSYAHVRRLVLAEREHRDAVKELATDVAGPLLRGRLPNPEYVANRRGNRMW